MFNKKPIILGLLLCLVAVSSFAVTYTVFSTTDSPVNSAMTVIGGSCCDESAASCEMDAAKTAESSPVDVQSQTVASTEAESCEMGGACCAAEAKTSTSVASAE